MRDKGTNRRQFFRGAVDKYTWVDLGSSFGMSDLAAAFLWAQLKAAERITRMRRSIWDTYNAAFRELEEMQLLRRPVIPEDCEHNAHMYYLLLPSGESRDAFLKEMRRSGIDAVFHYMPLHTAPAGLRYGRVHGELPKTQHAARTVVRLPLWLGIEGAQQERVISVATGALVKATAGARA